MNSTWTDAQYNRKRGTMLLTLATGLVLAVGAAATQVREGPTLTASIVPPASSSHSSRHAEPATVVYIVASEAQREALATLAHAELPTQPAILVARDDAQAGQYLAETQGGLRVRDLR